MWAVLAVTCFFAAGVLAWCVLLIDAAVRK